MRSVKAERKAAADRIRADRSRRYAAGRVQPERTFGRRAKFRNDPISRLLRAAKRQLSFRRPVLLLALLLLIVTAIAGLVAGGYPGRAVKFADGAVNASAVNAGFGVSAVHLSGNRHTSPHDILNALGIAPGQSIFTADIQAGREKLSRLPWIADINVTRRYPDALFIDIVEKLPFGLWQSDHGLFVVDRSGAPIVATQRSEFPKLPLFIGEAPEGASDLVEAIGDHRAVAARVEAMQRVSGRRWNLILDDGVLVKLPENGWTKELSILEALIVEKGILERDVTEIDLRSRDNYFFVLRNAVQRKISRGNAA
ncbi:MAG TPA: FtsQ-type POTRA domain-containing protein [Rhizomicrobium sp.]|jgi:cell division protein FtsQ